MLSKGKDRREFSYFVRRLGGTVAVLLMALFASACEGLLDVTLPGKVTEDALDDPGLAQTLFNSVQADAECAWNNYVAAAAHHSDEFMQSSANAPMKRWGLRDITGSYLNYTQGECEANYGLFLPLHTARVQANQNFDRISGFDIPGKDRMLAAIKAYGTFPLLAFGEGFCGTPLDGGGAVLEPAELLELAVDGFTDAIALAEAAGADDILNLARVARARALLDLDRYADAIADAELVTNQEFRFDATRDGSPVRRQNAQFRLMNGFPGGDTGQRHATVAPSYRALTWMGEDDPRVNATWDGAALGFDFSTPHWRHDKVNSFSTPVMMASYREAQMIIAEASALDGDLDTAIDILDDFHTAAGLQGITAAELPTQDDVIRHVIEERRREFFAEGGHRLRDHLRWRGTQFEIPFLGEPGSDHPNGVDQNGDPYGPTTCFPVPTIELTG